jgi:hypothetical protein
MITTAKVDRDLTQQPPHSPRVRLGDFAIACRTVDKCRASLNGTLGEYHYDCPLDNMLFSFKGINGEQFKQAVQAALNYEDVGTWLLEHGIPKTTAQIKEWSAEMEDASLRNDPDKRDYFIEECTRLGLDPDTATTFDWLEADDRASFKHPVGT